MKFSPIFKLNGNPLCAKYEGYWYTKFGFPAKTIKNIKWAWQAQFLSHNLLILQNCIFFEDKQMISVPFAKILKGIKVTNFGHSCHIHSLSHPCLSQVQIIVQGRSFGKFINLRVQINVRGVQIFDREKFERS